MKRIIAALFAMLLVVASTPLALAQVQDRIALRPLEGNATAHYSPALAIVAVSLASMALDQELPVGLIAWSGHWVSLNPDRGKRHRDDLLSAVSWAAAQGVAWRVLGNGSNDLLYQLVLATCEPTDEVLTHQFAFLSYRLSARRPHSINSPHRPNRTPANCTSSCSNNMRRLRCW